MAAAIDHHCKTVLELDDGTRKDLLKSLYDESDPETRQQYQIRTADRPSAMSEALGKMVAGGNPIQDRRGARQRAHRPALISPSRPRSVSRHAPARVERHRRPNREKSADLQLCAARRREREKLVDDKEAEGRRQ